MKKIYNAPSIMVVNVENDSILAASFDSPNNVLGNGIQLGRRRSEYFEDDYDDFEDEDF